MRIYVIISVLMAILFSLSYSGNISIAELPNGVKYIADKIVVSKTEGAPNLAIYESESDCAFTGIASIDKLCRKYRVIQIEPFYPAELRNEILSRCISGIYVFTLESPSCLQSAIYDLSRDPHIRYAEIYTLPELKYTPNDPMFYQQWFLPHIQAPEAWDVIRGDTTRHSVIAIIDTGVDWDNPDITPNIWINEAEDLNGNNILDPGDINGVDDDNNGFVDDVVGWDFVNDDEGPDDDQGHGTHVSGTIAALGNNQIGVIGMAPWTKIMALKGLNENGGGSAVDLANSVFYAAEMGADVLSNSWGGH